MRILLTCIAILSSGCGGSDPTIPVDVHSTVPGARWGHAMAYDERAHNVVLFGGSTNTMMYGDTWTWDGTAWTERTVPGIKPSPRDQHIMAYDPQGRRVLMYGGRTALTDATPNRELWAWDGGGWTLLNSNGPAVTGHESGGWDAERNRLVITTSSGNGPESRIAETWEWDGSTWTRSALTTPSPRTLPSRGTVFNQERHALFMLAGDLAGFVDVWGWDGGAWTVVSSRHAISPPGLMAGTASDDVLVLDESTAPNGTTWRGRNGVLTKEQYAGPPRRFVSSMVLDVARGTIVLFGGQAPGGRFLNDTWVWTSAGWTQK